MSLPPGYHLEAVPDGYCLYFSWAVGVGRMTGLVCAFPTDSSQEEIEEVVNAKEFLLDRFGIPPVDLAPGKVLKVMGVGEERLVGVHDFFVLAASVGWIGAICYKRLPGDGFCWELIYKGSWVQQYAQLIGGSRWPEQVFVVEEGQ